eukprot:201263-Heterocapsa_arctica.AAC.1
MPSIGTITERAVKMKRSVQSYRRGRSPITSRECIPMHRRRSDASGVLDLSSREGKREFSNIHHDSLGEARSWLVVVEAQGDIDDV